MQDDSMVTPERWKAFMAELTPLLPRLKTWAMKFTYNNELKAEDLVSESIIKGVRYFDLYEPGTNFKGWFYTLMKNTSLNAPRGKSGKMEKASKSYDQNELLHLAPGMSTSPDTFEEDFSDEVIEALALLPEYQREMILWAQVEGIPDHELAPAFGIAPGTVKSRLFRAREILRVNLEQFARQSGYTWTGRSGARVRTEGNRMHVTRGREE